MIHRFSMRIASSPSLMVGFTSLASTIHPARLALAEAALQAASRLRPDAGETHLARAQNLYWGYRDYDGALTELEVARQSLPNDRADIPS